MVARVMPVAALLFFQAVHAEWNPRLAAGYLDARQKIWFDWPTAKISGGPCLSCHTGFPYLLARPRLRQQLQESEPTVYEAGLLESVSKRLAKATPREYLPDRDENTGEITAEGQRLPSGGEELGVESVLAALLFAWNDRDQGRLSARTELAFDRMWLLQIRTGDLKGTWRWNSIDLDPWEQPESTFYGASLAALAAGSAPSDYQERSNIRGNLDALRAYFKRSHRAQPLHNRLIQLWASSRLNGILSEIDRQTICNDVLRRQASDGGWTLSSLGPWRKHPNARVIDGSNAYATALVAFILQRSGVSRDHPRLERALAWLQAHQDRTGGFWDAHSMNKQYPPDSVPVNFMRDAATSFAVLALLEGN